MSAPDGGPVKPTIASSVLAVGVAIAAFISQIVSRIVVAALGVLALLICLMCCLSWLQSPSGIWMFVVVLISGPIGLGLLILAFTRKAFTLKAAENSHVGSFESRNRPIPPWRSWRVVPWRATLAVVTVAYACFIWQSPPVVRTIGKGPISRFPEVVPNSAYDVVIRHEPQVLQGEGVDAVSCKMPASDRALLAAIFRKRALHFKPALRAQILAEVSVPSGEVAEYDVFILEISSPAHELEAEFENAGHRNHGSLTYVAIGKRRADVTYNSLTW